MPIHTIFLIDNSTSMPYSLREEVKNAISSYVSVMPGTESVKIAMFDTQTTVLADNYSNDPEFINYELSKVDFNGQASLVYDAVVNITNQMDSNQDIYYRTVLITDGVDSIEGTSFDYMRSIISENSQPLSYRRSASERRQSTGCQFDRNCKAWLEYLYAF